MVHRRQQGPRSEHGRYASGEIQQVICPPLAQSQTNTPKLDRKQSWNWNGSHTQKKESKTYGPLGSGSWLVDPEREARRRCAAVRWLSLAIQVDLSIFELHGESYTASWTEEARSRAWYSTPFDICILVRSSYTVFVPQTLQEAAFI